MWIPDDAFAYEMHLTASSLEVQILIILMLMYCPKLSQKLGQTIGRAML